MPSVGDCLGKLKLIDPREKLGFCYLVSLHEIADVLVVLTYRNGTFCLGSNYSMNVCVCFCADEKHVEQQQAV